MSQDSPKRTAPPPSDIDFRRIFFLMLGHWYWFLIALALAGTGAYLYLRYTFPVYRTTTTVLIEEGKNQPTPGTAELLEGFGLQPGNRNLDNQILILSSYTLIEKALKELPFGIDYSFKGRIRSVNCYPKNPILVIPDSSLIMSYNTPFLITYQGEKQYILSIDDDKLDTTLTFGQKFIWDRSGFTILPDPINWRLLGNAPILFTFHDLDKLTESYRQRLKVETASREGTIVKLTLEGTVKEKDKDFLNKLTEKFLESNLERKNKEASRIIEFIDMQLIGISDSLMITENRLEDFRSQHRIMNISAQGNQIIEQAVKLEDENARLILESNYFDYLNNYLSDANTQETPIAPTTMGISDPLLSQLVKELAQLQNEYYSGGIGKKNPLQGQMLQKITATRESLQESLKNLMKANHLAKIKNQDQIKSLNMQAAGLPMTERKLLGIEREFKLNDVMYTFLLQRRAEAQIQKASNTPDNELIDKARTEREPIRPKTNSVYIISILLGLGIPLVILMVMDFFNNKITTEDELRKISNLTIAGHIPHSDFDNQLVVLNKPTSNVAESYRSLRTRLQFITKNVKSPVILVTSSMPDEGKTFTALNLASAYSLTGKPTILIGFDLRRPKLYSDFNLINEKGVSTWLIKRDSIQDIIQPTVYSNLDLIAAGPIPPNPAELAASDRLTELFRFLKDKYEYIIIDSAPIGTVSDSYALSGMTDATLLVIRHAKTLRNMFHNTLSEAHANNLSGICILVNDIDSRNISNRYSYSYGYKYGYKYENSL